MFVLILIFFLLFSPQKVSADTGRFFVEPAQTEAQSGLPGIAVKVKVTLSSSDSTPSVGERVNVAARTGGVCALDTADKPTDDSGYIYAHCGRDSAGTISIYAFSITNNDESTDTVLNFTNVPTPTIEPTQTPAPTSPPSGDSNTPTQSPTGAANPLIPTNRVIKKPSTTSETGGFGGDGLSEDKGDGGGNGLGAGQVLGTGTQDIDSSGDKDLLGTLIFLTGTVVLVVWTIYAVLVQRGVISGGTKKERVGGITPRPLE